MISGHIEVVPYDPKWIVSFENQSRIIKNALGNCTSIHHIGSTSVPSLMSKPIIDIMCVVSNIEQVDNFNDSMQSIDYHNKGEFGIPFRRFFKKGQDIITHHLHIFEYGSPDINLHLMFRDTLRDSPLWRKKYESVKLKLAHDEHSIHKNHSGYKNYTLGKNEIIRDILRAAKFNGRCFRLCLHHHDWAQYHRIKDQQIFQSIGIIYNPNHPSITAPNHVHMVLYEGVEVVSIAHIEFLDSTQVALRALATDLSQQGRGHGKYLLSIIEKWLKNKGYKILIMHARLSAENFYRSLGYNDMPFDDPLLQPDNYIDLGKLI